LHNSNLPKYKTGFFSRFFLFLKKNKMKKIAIILVIVAIILGLYEQTKEKPNVIIEAVCIVVVMIAMMRLSSKTPSKNNEDDV